MDKSSYLKEDIKVVSKPTGKDSQSLQGEKLQNQRERMDKKYSQAWCGKEKGNV